MEAVPIWTINLDLVSYLASLGEGNLSSLMAAQGLTSIKEFWPSLVEATRATTREDPLSQTTASIRVQCVPNAGGCLAKRD